MYLSTFIALLCTVGCYAAFDAIINANNGKSRLNSPQITWDTPLTNGPGSGRCRQMGVLKLDFGAPGSENRKEKVRIDMWFVKPTGWVFNIGRSRTNNGYGGDSGSTSRDSEIQGLGSTFSIYGNDYFTPKGGNLVTKPKIIKRRLRIIISNGIVVWSNLGAAFNFHLNMNALFSLNGQVDAEGGTPNYNVYFAINRVIANTSRKGRGLCRAYIKWIS